MIPTAFPGQTSSTSGSSAPSAALTALNPTATHAKIKTRFIAAASTMSATSHCDWALSTPPADRSRTQVRDGAAGLAVKPRRESTASDRPMDRNGEATRYDANRNVTGTP